MDITSYCFMDEEDNDKLIIETQNRIAEIISTLENKKDNDANLEKDIIEIMNVLRFPIRINTLSGTITSYLYLNLSTFLNYQRIFLDYFFDKPNELMIIQSLSSCLEYASILHDTFSYETFWANKDRVIKFIKIVDMESDSTVAYDLFKKLSIKFWSPDVFKILFTNINVPKILAFLLDQSLVNPFEFAAFMKQTNCIQFALSNISRKEFAPGFFQIVASVVQITHDYFVDDFIQELDINHPIFSVDPHSIIIYGNENNTFAIPSLLPLVGTFSISCNFNLFLYGKYTIPIYRKLGYKFSDIPHITEAANFFILREDAIDFAKENPEFVHGVFDGKTRVPMFEFLPFYRPSFLYIGQSLMSFVFLVRFEEETNNPTPLIVVDGKTIFFDKGRLFYNGTRSKPIQIGAWKHIGIISNYSGIELFIENEPCFKLGTKTPFFVESIGSKDVIVNSRFSVMWNINGSMKPIPDAINFSQGPNISVKPGGSALFVRTNQIAEIFSDPDVLDVLIEKFEDSKDVSFFSFLLSLPNYAKINEVEFLKRLIYSMLIPESDQHTVLSLIMHLQNIKDETTRGEILYHLLISHRFWSSYESDLNSYLTALYGLFPSIVNQNIIENFCERGIIEFLFSMMTIKIHVTDIIQLILKEFIANSKNQKYSSMISDLAVVSSYYNPFDSIDQRANRLLKPNLKFLDNITLIMQDMNPIMSLEVRLKLALEMPINHATNLIIPYLLSLKSNDIPEDLIPVFSRTMQRFADSTVVWKIILSLLLDISINLENLDNPIMPTGNIKRPIFVCPILMMANCLIYSKSVDVQNIYDILNSILPTSPHIYTQSYILPYFVDFLCCGDRNVQLEFPHLEGKKEIIESISKVYSKLDFLQLITGKYKTKQPPLQHTEFASSFLMKIALQQQDLEGFLMVVANFASDNIYQLFLQRILSELVYKNDEKKVMMFINPLLWSIVNRYATVVIESAFTMILDFCTQKVKRILKFITIFVISLSTIPPEILQRFLEIISSYGSVPTQKSVFVSFYILYHVLNSLIPKELPFIQEFVDCIKEQINNYEVEESLTEFADIVRKSNTVNDLIITHEIAKPLSDHFLSEMSSIQSVTDSKIDLPIKDFNLLNIWYIKQIGKIISISENISNTFLSIVDIRMRSDESTMAQNTLKRNSHFLQTASKEDLQKWTKSYRITPFYKPPKVPSFVIPTPFELNPPGTEKERKAEKFEPLFEGKSPPIIFAMSKHVFSEFAYSMRLSFAEVFNILYPNASLVQSTVVRLYTRIPSVSFQTKDKLMIVVGAELKDKIQPIEEDEMFIDFVNECSIGSFGPFNLVLGHPILEVDLVDSLISFYNSCSRPAYLIYSRKNGVFILEVEHLMGIQIRQFSIELKKNEWIRGELSNMEYLLAANFASGRSFADLSSYPIFPRILLDATKPILDQPQLRDLSQTIQIVGDKDPEHSIFKQRFEVQKYFYTDNISNPHSVSAFLVRLSPFCLHQWSVNGQWDAGDRNVLDLGKHLSISSQTIYEIIPELFCFGDSLRNWHNFSLPDGTSLDAVLPTWTDSFTELADSLRHLLESEEVRQNLDKWLDLVFGIKQNSEEDFSVYYPLSYPKNDGEDKREWNLTCGQVPLQVFSEKHPPAAKLNRKLPKISSFAPVILDAFSGFVSVSNFSGRIHTANIRHISSDGRLLVMTTIDDEAIAFELVSFKEISRIRRRSALHSAISGSHYVCATAFPHEVVLWTVGSGRVFTVIEFESAIWIQFGAFDDSIYIGGLDNIIHRYSLCGSHIKALSRDDQIILFN